MYDLITCNERLIEIEGEINSIKKQISYYEQTSPEDQAINKITKIKGQILDYLQKISSILVKVCKLSNGMLLLKDGKVVYNGTLSLPQINMEKPIEGIQNAQNVVNTALKRMSTSGVKSDGLIALGAAAFLAILGYMKGHKVRRWGGIVMLLAFATYYVYLFAM